MCFLWCFLYGFGVFCFFSLLGLFWVFGRCFLLVASFIYIFVVVFSARALGAGFSPGVFSPTVSTASTMGWTGWKFVAALSIGDACYFCTYCFGRRPQLETKFIIGLKKKEKRKKRHGIWAMNHLH